MLPIPVTNMVKYITHVVVHECGHTLGLVPEAATTDGAHNSCNCGYHIMDDGYYRCPPMHFNRFWSFFWKPENAAYLEFILPKK